MSVMREDQIPAVGMLPSIHVNRTETLRAAYVEDDRPLEFAELDDLESIGRSNLARTGVRLAACVRRIAIVVGSPIFEQRLRPGLERNLVDPAVVGKGIGRSGVNHQLAAGPN